MGQKGSNKVPQRGTKYGAPKGNIVSEMFPSQVHTFFAWLDYLVVSAWCLGREPVYINLDETATQFNPRIRDLVLRQVPEDLSPYMIPRTFPSRRGMATFIALISDNDLVQRALPQFVVASPAKFSRRRIVAEAAHCPAAVRLVTQKSGWCDTAVMCDAVLPGLGDAVRPFRAQGLQPILLMDSFGPHVTARTVAACAEHGVWPVVVPTNLTWILQPLDVFAFRSMKAYLQRQFESDGDWLHGLYLAASQWLPGKSWAKAFAGCGVSARGQALTATLKRRVPGVEFWPRGANMPPDLTPVLPARSAGRLRFLAAYF